jgi:hypothetical protein
VLSIRPQVTVGLMQADVAGTPSLMQLLQMIDTLSTRARSCGTNALLIRAELQSVQDDATKAILGEHIAEQMNGFAKIACVDPRPCESRAMEVVANRFGARVRVFDEEGTARKWLESSQESTDFQPAGSRRVL